MCTKKIQTALFFAMFLCFGIIQVHSQALDIVNSTGDTLLHVKNDGKVGIGTTNPRQKLEVFESAADYTQIQGPTIKLQSDNSGLTPFTVDLTGNASLIADFQDNGTSVLAIENGGNVGIGTTTPGRKLHIHDGTNSAIAVERSNVSGRLSIWSYNGAENVRFGTTTTDDVNFITDNSVRMTIKDGGNVGIGTTTPLGTFHVNTSVPDLTRIIISETGDTQEFHLSGISFLDGPNFKGGIFKTGTFHDMTFWSAGNERMRIQQNGNVGIGTTSPDHDLEIGTGTFSEIDAGESQFTTSSSRTYKENIHPLTVANLLDKISKIPVNTYDFKPEYCDDDEQKCKDKLGLIAENFHTVFGRGSEKEIRGQEVQMALWLAVQELTKENTELKAKVAEFDAMQTKMAQFESTLKKLTAATATRGSEDGTVTMVNARESQP